MRRLAPLVLIAVVAGCGGGADAPSKAEFAKQADAICAAAERHLTAIGTNGGDRIAAVDKLIDETRGTVDKLKALDRPDGAAGEAADQFIASLERDVEDKGVPALERLRDALRKRDAAAAVKAARELEAIDSTATDKLAIAAGAKGCAS